MINFLMEELFMSKYMEIEIKLVPAYGSGGLTGRFPNLVKLLKNHGYDRVVEKEPSLYELVDVLTRIRNDPAIDQSAKRAILNMHDSIQKVRDEAREHLLGRRLNELDQSLYRLEDLFNDLEQEFGW